MNNNNEHIEFPITDELVIGKKPDFSRRVLFLDFDGVINLGGHPHLPENETRKLIKKWRSIPRTGEWEDFICSTIHMAYHPEVVDMLRDLNCVWISSWKDLTQTKLNPMLDFDFGYVNWKYRGFSDWGFHGKVAAVGKIVHETGCEWAVVDDDVGRVPEVLFEECGGTGLVIAPDTDLGLSVEECEAIKRAMS